MKVKKIDILAVVVFFLTFQITYLFTLHPRLERLFFEYRTVVLICIVCGLILKKIKLRSFAISNSFKLILLFVAVMLISNAYNKQSLENMSIF